MSKRNGKQDQVEDHRTRVAAERREKTRARLMESALAVFAEKGPRAVIDDVIARAGMARGSFYNYFATNEELLAAVAAEISDELVRAIDPHVVKLADPVERVACGSRMLLHAVVKYPLFGVFVSKLPLPTSDSTLLGVSLLARDLILGIAAKRFTVAKQRVAIDFVLGVNLSALHALAKGGTDRQYPEAMTKAVLLGLGVKEKEAERIVALKLPELVLPDTALLLRAQEKSDA